MDYSHSLRIPRPHRWTKRLSRCLRAACVGLLLAVGTTWLGASYDFPIDPAVAAGMAAPECAAVRHLPPHSLLVAALPDSEDCWPLFLYRTSFPDAPANAAAYEAWTLHQRVGEFWQLIGYVLVLWFAFLGVVALVVAGVRKLFFGHFFRH